MGTPESRIARAITYEKEAMPRLRTGDASAVDRISAAIQERHLAGQEAEAEALCVQATDFARAAGIAEGLVQELRRGLERAKLPTAAAPAQEE